MKLVVVFFVCTAVAFAQGGGAIVGVGYNLIAPVSVAPGQVITVFVTGVGNVTQKVSAGGPPLPTKLGGISATLLLGGPNTPAPIFAVFPFSACSTGQPPFPCVSVTGVTLQIPFELRTNVPGSLGPPVIAYLQVSDDAGHTASVLLDPEPDEIHVLQMQDTVLVAELAQRPGPGSAAVTHLNGTLVSAANPAQPGEKLVMYAVGLGVTNPPVKTGLASPLPAVSVAPQGVPTLVYDYRPNAQPWPHLSLFAMGSPILSFQVSFVGLSPGFVGLYQLNFVVPAPPAGTPPCAVSPGVGGSPFSNVFSNLTVTLLTAS